MARRYVMTAKRRAALRKAQLASARKRRRSRQSAIRKAAGSRRTQSARGSGQHRKVAYKNYDKAVELAYRSSGKSARSAKVHAKARKYGRRAVKAYGVAAIAAPGVTLGLTMTAVTGSRSYAKGFGKGVKRGYQGRRIHNKRVAHNLSRMGPTRVERVPQLALTARGTQQTRHQRRRYA